MPTGYTCDVQNGKITDFRTFAMRCARNFGACVMMRDDPMDAPIKEFEPSPYYASRIAEYKAELAKFESMTDAEWESYADAEFKREMFGWQGSCERRATEKARYERMLAEVEKWTPPSSDHLNMKNFMLEQLIESIKFDCCESYGPPTKLTGAQMKSLRLESAAKDIAYAMKNDAEEKQRAVERNRWVAQLRDSLK